MAMPAPIAEKYMNCIDCTLTVGSGVDTWAGTVMDGTITGSYSVDEMTNNTSGGGYEDVKTIYKYEGTLTIAYNASSPPPFSEGDVFPVVMEKPTSGPYFSGNFRFNDVGYPMYNVKGGMKLTVKVTSQGAVSKTRI